MNPVDYGTRTWARAEAIRMQGTGWPKARAVSFYLPKHKFANRNGNVFAVSVGAGKFLRADGCIQ